MKRTTGHARLHDKEQLRLQNVCGRRAVSRGDSNLLFMSPPFFPHTRLSGVKSSQSLCGAEPIIFPLDDITSLMGQCWKGRGVWAWAWAWKGASLLLPLQVSRRDSRAQGPLSYHFRQNQDIPQMDIPDQRLFSAHTKCTQSPALLFTHSSLV